MIAHVARLSEGHGHATAKVTVVTEGQDEVDIGSQSKDP